jgi:hypothetical protein
MRSDGGARPAGYKNFPQMAQMDADEGRILDLKFEISDLRFEQMGRGEEG